MAHGHDQDHPGRKDRKAGGPVSAGQSYRGPAAADPAASFYRAALPFLDEVPAWGALSGVRPTKLVSRHLMAGGTLKSADRMLREVYDVSEPRRKLCLQAAKFTMGALEQQRAGTFPCMWGYPFVPPVHLLQLCI